MTAPLAELAHGLGAIRCPTAVIQSLVCSV
jgi:hypothetical protein